MGLLDKLARRNNAPGQQLYTDGIDLPTETTLEGALLFAVGLSDAEYQQFNKVVIIQRNAAKHVAEALGKELEPVTYLNPPSPIADLQTLEPVFLETPVKKPKAKKK